MTFQFVAPELGRWDALGQAPGGAPELLVVPFFADERPLRGTAGLCDWRMCGRLARLLRSGRVTGARHEATLLPGRGLCFARLLLFGLGPSEGFDEARFRAAAREIARVTGRLGATRYAIALPGRASGLLGARRALELWLAEAPAAEADDVWLVEPPAAQKDLSEALGRRAGRSS